MGDEMPPRDRKDIFLRRMIIGGCVVVCLLAAANVVRKGLSQGSDFEGDSEVVFEQDEPARQNRMIKTRKGWRVGGYESVGDTSTSGGVAIRLVGKIDPLISQKIRGFIIDDFRNWKSLPDGYKVDGLKVAAQGGVALEDLETTGTRTGIMVSPPLKLFKPAMEAASQKTDFPDGTEMKIEISLIDNQGKRSPWVLVSRYVKPDGNLVEPMVKRSLTPGTVSIPEAILTGTETSSSHEMIQYRMTLSGSLGRSPVVKDLRIWHVE